ncbi:MAG: tetratricopeptide repeat protein [Syntrophobacteraceae bacterium]
MCAMSIIGKLNRNGMEACRKGLFEEAESFLLAALDQARVTRSVCTEAKIRNNLGIIYESQGIREKAFHHYGMALSLMRTKLSTNHPLHGRLERSMTRVSPLR